MDSSKKEEIALLSVILFDNKSSVWVREIFQRREEHGVFSNLVTELQLGDREYYFIFLQRQSCPPFVCLFLFICTLYFKMNSKRQIFTNKVIS